MNASAVKALARQCGFELAGVTPAVAIPEALWYLEWVRWGYAGEMLYLVDHRAEARSDPRSLLPTARSVICVGKLYNGPEQYSTQFHEAGRGWISRYAWGQDYHRVLRKGLRQLARRMAEASPRPFEWKIAVDTAPLLERAYARRAGLGWIGKNSSLINQDRGSWFFLGALLVSLELERDCPPPDRCGSCTRCIDACPTGAILPTAFPTGPSHTVDSRLCISYLTIELRGEIPGPLRARVGRHVFGCDICQDVCPWNRRAPVTADPAFAPRHFAPELERLAALTPEEYAREFHNSAVRRAGYRGLLRNARVAAENATAGSR